MSKDKFKKENDKEVEIPVTEGHKPSEAEELSAKNNKQAEEKAQQDENEAAKKLEKAEEELAEMKDKYLRQVAEFDNYRKRTMKEKAELILNGGQKVIESLLPILDDLQRAHDNIEKSNDIETLKQGVELITSKLYKTLGAHGLKEIETEGKDFDTDFHEAVALIPSPEADKKNKIIDCVQKGYTLNDKVIRHSKVVVGQ